MKTSNVFSDVRQKTAPPPRRVTAPTSILTEQLTEAVTAKRPQGGDRRASHRSGSPPPITVGLVHLTGQSIIYVITCIVVAEKTMNFVII